MSDDEREVAEDPPAPDADTPVMQTQFKALMDTLGTLRKEIKSSAEETVDSVSHKIKKEKDGYHFKKRGHKLQFEFNDEVLGKVEEVDSIIKKLPVTESNKAGLESAKELLQRGMALIIWCQKHIKMAERSDNGWAVVQEYKADELADNSDDEKKIEKAERAMEKKAVVAARKRKSTRPFSHQLPKIQKLEQPAVAAAQQPTMQLKPSGRFPVVPSVQPIGPCHHCFEYGHLQQSCPLLHVETQSGAKGPPASRTYPLSGSVSNNKWFNCSSNTGEVKGMIESDSSVPSDDQVMLDGGGCDVMSDDVGEEIGEYEEGEACLCKHPPVKGKLKDSVEFWESVLQASLFIIDTITNGYPIPFASYV